MTLHDIDTEGEVEALIPKDISEKSKFGVLGRLNAGIRKKLAHVYLLFQNNLIL